MFPVWKRSDLFQNVKLSDLNSEYVENTLLSFCWRNLYYILDFT